MSRRVLILEDMPAARRWLREAVAQAFDAAEVVEAASLAETATLDLTAFDLALVDLVLPDGSGLGLVSRARREHPGLVAIITTVLADDRAIFTALRAGAQGYLLKEEPVEVIAERLRGIDRGEPALTPAVARRLLGHFAAPVIDGEARLTPRETEVLRLLAKGLAVAEVAEALEIRRNTAAGYIKDIYRKLEISSRAEAALEAVRLGLIDP